MSYEGTRGVLTEYVVLCGDCKTRAFVRKGTIAGGEASKPIQNKEAAGRVFRSWGWSSDHDGDTWRCAKCGRKQGG